MTIEKGQVLNPLGRGARKPVSDAIRALLARPAEDALTDKPKTIAQQIALNLVTQALGGENAFSAAKEVIDRVEGKPAQAIVGDDSLDPVRSVISWAMDANQ